MKKHRTYLAGIGLALALAACNADIFVEDTRPSETEVVLEGDGSTHTLTFQPNGLRHIGISNYGAQNHVSYFNRDGDAISPDNITDIARISYDDPRFNFEIRIEGKQMTLQSLENLITEQPMELYLTLTYDYMSVGIQVTINPQKPLELVNIVYRMDEREEKPGERAYETTFFHTNNSDEVFEGVNQPLRLYTSTACLELDEKWTQQQKVTIPLITFLNGIWQTDDQRTLRIGETYEYKSKYCEEDPGVPFSLAPHKRSQYSFAIFHTSVRVPCELTFRLPSSGQEKVVSGTYTVNEPTDYKMYTYED